jgi:hypothetical protein
MQLTEKITNLLSALGDNYLDVASRLAQEECYGERSQPWSCPVSGYVNKHLPPEYLANVSLGFVRLCQRHCVSANWLTIYLPKAVADCVANFDRGFLTFLELSRR